MTACASSAAADVADVADVADDADDADVADVAASDAAPDTFGVSAAVPPVLPTVVDGVFAAAVSAGLWVLPDGDDAAVESGIAAAAVVLS